jgi:hypothetical protein
MRHSVCPNECHYPGQYLQLMYKGSRGTIDGKILAGVGQDKSADGTCHPLHRDVSRERRLGYQ